MVRNLFSLLCINIYIMYHVTAPTQLNIQKHLPYLHSSPIPASHLLSRAGASISPASFTTKSHHRRFLLLLLEAAAEIRHLSTTESSLNMVHVTVSIS